MEQDNPLLFRRRTLEEEICFDNEAALDRPHNNQLIQIPADQIIDAVGGMLEQADHALDELTSSDLLGTAIFRGCRDLADAVGHLAHELEQQSEDDRRALADACLQDVQESAAEAQLLAQAQLSASTDTNTNQQLLRQVQAARQQQSSPQMQELSTMTVDDIVSALSGASTLLRDVEMGLRGIEQDEAEEIADVALCLARLFVASLQSVHSSIVQEEEDRQQLESDRFEVLEDDEDDNGDETKNDGTDNTTTTNSTTKQRSQRDQASSSSSRTNKQRNDRLRVLWPPLGPAVAAACDWGKDEATKQPLLAVALGIAMWPVAVVTAFVGAPLVIADTLVQHSYNSFQEGPIVSNVEKAAAQAFQAGKLSLLCGKLVGRQSLRVLDRQIKRNGGIGNIAQNVGGMAVERALHPIETAGVVWEGLQWGLGVIQSNLHLLNGDNERRDAFTESDV